MIAHCLVAGQFTIPSHFTVHSMHCYFVLAGDSEIPVIYHVNRVREGKSFATRTVQAKQKGRCIFTTTISFTHDNSETAVITHTTPLPKGIKPPPNDGEIVEMMRANKGRPFLSSRFKASNAESNNPHERKARQWIKAVGKISPGTGYKTHISALAYMSDSYFIGSVPMIHGVLRHWPKPEELSSQLSSEAESSKRNKRAGVVSMLVSLDHTIYFHQARGFMADEWIFAEVSSPWSGDGRAVVTQHMFARDGTLIATCFQEVRLLLSRRYYIDKSIGSCENATR